MREDGRQMMSGWLVAVPYEVNGGTVTHEALFAVWHPDQAESLRIVRAFRPRGSQITPRPVIELNEAILRGLKLNPGEAGLLQVH